MTLPTTIPAIAPLLRPDFGAGGGKDGGVAVGIGQALQGIEGRIVGHGREATIQVFDLARVSTRTIGNCGGHVIRIG